MSVATSKKTVFRVAGVTFLPSYPSNLHRLRPVAEQAWAAGECLTAVLIRNPQNQYDANAIEIHVPVMNTEAMVGHMPATIAARCAPLMDQGARFAAEVVGVAVSHIDPNKPGLDVRVWRVES